LRTAHDTARRQPQRRIWLAVFVLGLVFVTAALAGAFSQKASAADLPNDRVLVPGTRLGAFEFYPGGRVASYRPALAAFGKPDAQGSAYQSNVCTVRWTSLGVDLDFASTLKPCQNLARSAWYGATVYAPRWKTDRGLRVGDSIQRLRALYPKAKLLNLPPKAPTWVLQTHRVDGLFSFRTLVATASGGRVTSMTAGPKYVF
jgi:hypothetical protein